MIDWLAFKILILFYKTDFFLIYSMPFWIFKRFQKLEIWFILESFGHQNTAENLKTLGQVKKSYWDSKIHPCCLTSLVWSIFNLPCQLWGAITFVWVFELFELNQWVSTKLKARILEYYLYNLMEKLYSALCLWIVLYTHYFNFLIFIYFTNQITLKQSLAQRLKLIFKFSSVKRQINIPRWTHLEHQGWRKDGKSFTRCYTIALKFWDEFNVNFVLLYFLKVTSATKQ